MQLSLTESIDSTTLLINYCKQRVNNIEVNAPQTLIKQQLIDETGKLLPNGLDTLIDHFYNKHKIKTWDELINYMQKKY